MYGRYCATCHGKDGAGKGPTARFLKVKPRDLTTGEYRWRTTPTGSLPTDADIVRTIERGAPGTSMPAWKRKLPEADILAVTQYIKTFSPRFEEDEAADPEDLEPPIEMPKTVPVLDAASARRGKQLYALMQCWSCHGVDGAGDGPSADTLKDSKDQPIEAYDFTTGQYRSGGTPLDIYRTFTTGENGTPMPSYDEALMVGRESFADLKPHEAVLGPQQMQELRAYIQTLPTSDEIDELSEDQLKDVAAARRWDLVAYMLSLSEGNSFWRWMTQDPYVTR